MEIRRKEAALVHGNSMDGNLKLNKIFMFDQDKHPFLEDKSHN
jgi:hypothetical protein